MLTPYDLLSRAKTNAIEPLARFMDDALTHCIGSNYASVVNRLQDRHGKVDSPESKPVNSAFDLDLPGLLQLINNCTYMQKPHEDRHDESVWKAEFRALFGVPQTDRSRSKTVRKLETQVASVRDSRNDYDHMSVTRQPTIQKVSSDLHKYYDLYCSTLSAVVANHPSVFQAETIQSLNAFAAQVNEMLDLIRTWGPEAGQEFNNQSSKDNGAIGSGSPPSSSTGKSQTHLRVAWLLGTILATGLMAWGLVSIVDGDASESSPSKSIVVVQLSEVPYAKREEFGTFLSEIMAPSSTYMVYVARRSRNSPDSAMCGTDVAGWSQDLDRVLGAHARVLMLEEYIDLFDVAYRQLRKVAASGRKPVLIILGNSFIDEQKILERGRRVKLYSQDGLTAWWLSSSIPPPYFVRFSHPNEMDSILSSEFGADAPGLRAKEKRL